MKVNVVDAIMGVGKAQPLDSLVFTKDGYKKMNEIQLGQRVYGEDGILHEIIGIYPQGYKKIYKITFSDDTYTECCDEHLWTYQKPQDKLKGIYRTESLSEIMKYPLYKETNRGDKNWQYFIPITKPIKYDKINLPVDPYVLGVLIGDGCYSSKSKQTIKLTNSEIDIIERVSNKLGDEYSLKAINEKRISNTVTYTISDNARHGRQHNIKGIRVNRLLAEFDKLKLLGKKANKKEIPEIYLHSEIKDRIELLRGLIDTDGEVYNNNIVFSTTSKVLADQIKFLVQSLSGTAKIAKRMTYYTYKGLNKNGLESYRIYIKMPKDIIIFSSKKHSDNYTTGNTSPHRSIKQIEYIGEKECQCILIDSETHLYLTNDLIVTHNTSSAINFINQADEDTKFLYITPYLTEVNRIITSCPNKKFKQPESYGTKINGIKHLFEKGGNIVSTHALFSMFDDEIIDLAYSNNYTLIMDEVADVISPLTITKHDLAIILRDFTHIEEGNILVWDVPDYTGEYRDYKKQCDLKCIGIYDNQAIVWLFPVSTFRAFRNIYILTYMFHAQTQKYYYDYYGIEYNYLYIKGDNVTNYSFTNSPVNYNIPDYSKLIHICDNEKLNRIGDMDTALSKTWYDRNANNKLMTTLKNATSNYFKNYTKTKSSENLWTTFKSYQAVISGKGYSKGFLSSNVRATNEYKDRTSVAYLVNKYFNPYVKNFFTQNKIAVNEDAYAVSEMIQFIWRSAIRDKREINLYIPSSRMRNLLIDWINTDNK